MMRRSWLGIFVLPLSVWAWSFVTAACVKQLFPAWNFSTVLIVAMSVMTVAIACRFAKEGANDRG